MNKQLTRYNSDKIVTGVCGGVASYFNINPTWVRLGVVAGTLATGVWPGLVAYGVMTFVMPNQGIVGRVEDDDIVMGSVIENE